MKKLETSLRSAANSSAAYPPYERVTGQSKVSRIARDRRYDGISAD